MIITRTHISLRQTLRKNLRTGWEGAYEAKCLGVSPGKNKRARLGLDSDVSSSFNEFAPAVLANIPSKCERCGAATAWMNDKYRPELFFV